MIEGILLIAGALLVFFGWRMLANGQMGLWR